jgi:CheY-like chemotaxis protein
MTPVNGLELLQKIRTGYLRGIATNLPFILFTAHGNSSVVTTALNLDVSACLVKPASAHGLGKAIIAATSKQLVAKPSAFYARIEVNDSPNQKGASPVRTTSDWAKWVKQGKPEYFDAQASHINRSGLDLSDEPEPDGPIQIRNIRHKALGAIQVGQILVEDFIDDEGVVLLVAGTVVTEKILTRLRTIDEQRSEKLKLWVGRPK